MLTEAIVRRALSKRDYFLRNTPSALGKLSIVQ